MTQLMPLLSQQASTTEPERNRRTHHLRALQQPATEPAGLGTEGIAVRMLGDVDRSELERVAEVDSAVVPGGARVLGAEVDGRLVAAVSLDSGAVIADPFRPSSAAIELLRLRARQLDGEKAPRRRRWSGLRRGHARGGLAGSPPGGGGRLLQL